MKLIELLILTISFLGYKVILVLICTLSSFLNVYDTSTSLILKQPKNILQKIIASLTRWDNIYYITLARRGLLFEQEWAFGPAFPYLIRLFTDKVFSNKSLYNYAFTSIIISHLFHFFSIFFLYYLTFKIYHSRDMAIVSSLLYLISPSGIFLSAGYTESFFSFITFLGFIFFENDYNFLAALVWCIASIIRSNGLFLKSSQIIGIGFFWIQYRAYVEFCWPQKQRNWCFKRLPLIYSFVQNYYWNVGPFRYFTVSQIPNFILASPAVYISIKSGVYYFSKNRNQFQEVTWKLNPYYIAQLFLTIMCVCVMHVQIFTRMISCLPGIYWWLANCLLNDQLYSDSDKTSLNKRVRKKSLYWVKIWVSYELVQAVLFGAFLPPA
ncbi:hypothetical protein PCANB_002383 [Pneumocystis canis]|nr:hypothetical protein PCANB_002383 [Pneumocystis canis]